MKRRYLAYFLPDFRISGTKLNGSEDEKRDSHRIRIPDKAICRDPGVKNFCGNPGKL